MKEALVLFVLCILSSKTVTVCSLNCSASDPTILLSQNFTNLNHTTTECAVFLNKMNISQVNRTGTEHSPNANVSLSCFSLNFISNASENVISIKGCARQNDSCDFLTDMYFKFLPKNFTVSKSIKQECVSHCNTEMCNNVVLEASSSTSTTSTIATKTTSKKTEPSKSSSYQISALFWVLFLISYCFL